VGRPILSLIILHLAVIRRTASTSILSLLNITIRKTISFSIIPAKIADQGLINYWLSKEDTTYLPKICFLVQIIGAQGAGARLC
jgi:hypothetical protein